MDPAHLGMDPDPYFINLILFRVRGFRNEFRISVPDLKKDPAEMRIRITGFLSHIFYSFSFAYHCIDTVKQAEINF